MKAIDSEGNAIPTFVNTTAENTTSTSGCVGDSHFFIYSGSFPPGTVCLCGKVKGYEKKCGECGQSYIKTKNVKKKKKDK